MNTAELTTQIVHDHLKARGFAATITRTGCVEVSLNSRAVDCNEVWLALDTVVDRDQVQPHPTHSGHVIVLA